jgi:predicted GIY-YIG superfamily endonuclease
VRSLIAHFAETEVRSRQSGIYLLVRDDVVLYVGSSRDVHSRIASHDSLRRRNASSRRREPIPFTRVFWLALPHRKALAYEAALLRALRPEFNTKIPRVMHLASDGKVLARFGVAGLDVVEENRR